MLTSPKYDQYKFTSTSDKTEVLYILIMNYKWPTQTCHIAPKHTNTYRNESDLFFFCFFCFYWYPYNPSEAEIPKPSAIAH